MFMVTDFSDVKIGRFKYLFVMFAEALHYGFPSIVKAREAVATYFAAALGPTGAVIRSFTEKDQSSYEYMTKKDWPDDVKALFKDGFPSVYLAVVDTDLDQFTPEASRYILLRFRADASDNEMLSIVHEIQQVVASGKDLFDWWNEKEKKEDSYIRKFGSAIQLKPGAFGVGVDLKKLFGKKEP